MTETPPPRPPAVAGATRRKLLLSALAAAAAARPGLSAPLAPQPFPTDITATLAGPADGEMAFWSRPVLAALLPAMPPGTRFRAVPIGATDGVTGANQFEARTAPDGASLMLAPGAAPLAWLVGDPRAQFDIGHWVPLMAGTSPAIAVLRGGTAALAAAGGVRVAAQSLVGPDLALLLAIDLLGARPVAVALPPGEAALAALAGGRVDAVLLRGRAAAEDVGVAGAAAVFSLGVIDDNGERGRDAEFARLPTLAEFHTTLRGGPPGGALFDAWHAVAAAAQLDFAAVLPRLTPAAMVALWRRAGAEAIQAPELRRAAGDNAVRLASGMAGTAAIAAAMADTTTLLELRRWLGAQFDWHPA